MDDASASVRAAEKEEKREKQDTRKKRKQPEACIFVKPPPWMGPRLPMGESKEENVNDEGFILRRGRTK